MNAIQFLIYAISFTPMMDVCILVGGGVFSRDVQADSAERQPEIV
jgi:hypothetical protein